MKKHLTARNLLLLLVIAFFGSLIWSMGYETLLPLLRAEQWLAFIANLVGLPLILIGTAVMLWGFWLFLSGAGGSQTSQPITPDMSREQRKAAQRQALAQMKPGLIRLVSGLLMIALGGYIATLG